MAKLSAETTEIINSLKQESLDTIDAATALEITIFQLFGETEQTLSYMEETKNIADEAISSFSRLSTLQLQIAQAQPLTPSDILRLLAQTIARTEARIPA
jgi:hypothetical protein